MKNIIIKPLITEKSMRDAMMGRFTFVVDIDANKSEIAHAIDSQFNVKTTKLQTVTTKGKSKRAGRTRKTVQGSDWKKAIATLSKGQKIDLFDVTEGTSPKSS